jgi:hypothetical protein
VPIVLGILLGVFLTIAAAFAYDTGTGRASNGLPPSAAGGHPPMVNWDVVSDNWHGVQSDLQKVGEEVQNGWRRLRS